jgi:hypothetical protein
LSKIDFELGLITQRSLGVVVKQTGQGKTMRATALLGAVTAAVCGMCAPAYAGDTIQLTVQGHVTAACSLSGGSSVQLGDVTGTGTKSLALNVNCNAPFAYALVSTNGALKSDGVVKVIGGVFQTSQPYTVTTSFVTDVGAFGDTSLASSTLTATNAAPCEGATFSNTCPFANSGAGVALNQSATLTIGWSAPTAPLVAGTYSDTLTVVVRAM